MIVSRRHVRSLMGKRMRLSCQSAVLCRDLSFADKTEKIRIQHRHQYHSDGDTSGYKTLWTRWWLCHKDMCKVWWQKVWGFIVKLLHLCWNSSFGDKSEPTININISTMAAIQSTRLSWILASSITKAFVNFRSEWWEASSSKYCRCFTAWVSLTRITKSEFSIGIDVDISMMAALRDPRILLNPCLEYDEDACKVWFQMVNVIVIRRLCL